MAVVGETESCDGEDDATDDDTSDSATTETIIRIVLWSGSNALAVAAISRTDGDIAGVRLSRVDDHRHLRACIVESDIICNKEGPAQDNLATTIAIVLIAFDQK